jgi:hypothetical protein
MRIMLLLIAVLVGGCTSQQVLDNAQTANALIDLRIQYDSASEALDAFIDQMPTEAGLQLLELQQDADRFVAEVTAAWRASPDLSPEYLDGIYQRGRALYLRGYDIILPIVDTLPPGTVTALVRLQAQAERIDAMYQQIKSQDAETRRMIAAGLELATLALKIGVLAL